MVVDGKTQSTLHILNRLCFGSLLISIVLMTANFQGAHMPWLVPFIPMWFLLLLVPITAHILLQNLTLQFQESVKVAILFGLYNIIVTIGVFLLLVALKVDEILNIGWGFVFGPIWYGLGIYLGFAVLCFPSLWDRAVAKKRQAVMLVLWGVAMILSSIFYVLYKETSFPTELCIVMSPLIILGVIHLVACLVPIIRMKLNPGLGKMPQAEIEIAWLAFVITTAIIILIKYMITDELPGFVIMLPVLKIVFFVFMERERYYAKVKQEGFKYLEYI